MQRDVLIIAIAIAVAIIVGGALFFFSAPEPVLAPIGSGDGTSVTVAVIDEGTYAALEERRNYRITREEDFADVWTYAYGDNAPPMPRVDFDRYEVLAVFDGGRPTGGYAVLVSKVIDESDVRTVTITHLEPGTGCVTIQALSSPFQFVRVPKSDKEIEREEKIVKVPCG